MKSYSDLFTTRGSAYDRAMRTFPLAREQEFRQVVERAGIESGMVVGDVPAGGGYLRHFLPADCHWMGHEPCASFTHHGGDPSAANHPLLPLPWQDASLDVLVSLAGVHHLEDKGPLFAEMRRVVKPGGRLILSDVAKGSNVSIFLDGFVGAHNSTGHEGVFLDENTLVELAMTGWRALSVEIVPLSWRFAGVEEMAAFCRLLFDLVNARDEGIIHAIGRELGYNIGPTGEVDMNWSLMTIVAE